MSPTKRVTHSAPKHTQHVLPKMWWLYGGLARSRSTHLAGAACPGVDGTMSTPPRHTCSLTADEEPPSVTGVLSLWPSSKWALGSTKIWLSALRVLRRSRPLRAAQTDLSCSGL